jgi:hypothetical protein
VRSSLTQYGFEWGPMIVKRLAYIPERGYCIEIHGPKGYNGPQIQVLVSEKGHAITAFPINGAKVQPTAEEVGKPSRGAEASG